MIWIGRIIGHCLIQRLRFGIPTQHMTLTSCDAFSTVDTQTVQRWFQQYKGWIQNDASEPRRLLDFVNTPRQYRWVCMQKICFALS